MKEPVKEESNGWQAYETSRPALVRTENDLESAATE